MAYIEKVITVPNIDAFVLAIVNFAVSDCGYTNFGKTTDGVYVIKKGDIFFSFYPSNYTYYVTNYGFFAKMSLTQPTNVATYLTAPGQQVASFFSTWASQGPFVSYYIYNTEDAIHAVLEVYQNVFAHFSFGKIRKAGTWNGGEYITASNLAYKSYSTADFDSVNYYRNCPPFDGGCSEYIYQSTMTYPSARPGFVYNPIGSSTQAENFAPIGKAKLNNQLAKMVVSEGMFDSLVYNFGVINFNMRNPIFPVHVRLLDPVTQLYFNAGEIPGVGYLNGSNIEEGSIVDTNWQVFPVTARQNLNAKLYPGSPNRSLAYLRQ